MTHIAFIALCALGLAYFLYRRRFDPMAAAFGGAIVYFAPGILGWTQMQSGSRVFYSQPIEPRALAVMSIVIGCILFSTLAVDRVPSNERSFVAPSQHLVPVILLAIGAGAAAVSATQIGGTYFCDKDTVLAHLDQWYYYAAYAIPTAVVTALVLRQWVLAAIGVGLLLLDLIVGFRSEAAMAFLALVVLSGGALFSGWRSAMKFCLICVVIVFGFFFIKSALYVIKAETSMACESSVAATITGAHRVAAPKPTARLSRQQTNALLQGLFSLNAVGQAFLHSEPFVIQATLNETVRQEFKTGSHYLIGQVLSGVPGGKLLFGIDSDNVTTFNSRAQAALFPNVKFGMANSPWAQAYAAGGYGFVLLFAGIWSALMAILTLAFRQSSGAAQGFVAVVAAWLGFYFGRNDLFIEIGELKFVVYIGLFAFLTAWIIGLLLRSAKGKERVSG